MDDPLRAEHKLLAKEDVKKVLILVVMDDPLRAKNYKCCDKDDCVLILVVMDDPLRVHIILHLKKKRRSLNPCCNG